MHTCIIHRTRTEEEEEVEVVGGSGISNNYFAFIPKPLLSNTTNYYTIGTVWVGEWGRWHQHHEFAV